MPTLGWLHREAAFQTAAQVPTRVLRPHTAGHRFGDPTGTSNQLIQGDNLEALKALLPFYRGRVKCIFIDPPYNTRSAFEHYDDNLEHSHWLGIMPARLQVLRELLSEDGSGCPRFSRAKGCTRFRSPGPRRFSARCVGHHGHVRATIGAALQCSARSSVKVQDTKFTRIDPSVRSRRCRSQFDETTLACDGT